MASPDPYARIPAARRIMHASDQTDVSLLHRIAARDTAALADLYDRHSRLLFGLVVRILRDRGESEEILQEAFVRIWTRTTSVSARRWRGWCA